MHDALVGGDQARLLTLDLGTTLYKVALFDRDGRMLHVERTAPRITHPQPTWSELDPKAFLQCIIDAVGRLRGAAGDDWNHVCAVSFATQANSFTIIDAANRPLTPLILWPDQRAAEMRDKLAAIASMPEFRKTTGMPRFGPLLGLAKLLWLRRHRPDVIAGARRFCYLSDYLTLLFTGRHCSEAGVAGLSGAADIRRLRWWDVACEQLNVPMEWLPPIVRAGTDLGPLLPEIADLLGVPHSCRFIVGCLDQYAGAIGTGTVESGRVCETTGTVLAAVRLSDRLEDNLAPDVYQGPAFQEARFFQMSFSSTSANILDWCRNQQSDNPSFEQLTREAADAAPSDLKIEPYHDSGAIESSFRNVRPHHTRGQVVRAIMERVAQSLAEQVRSLCPHGLPAEIRAAGGAAKNDLWLRIKAKALGTAISAVECDEPTSLGAAMLAASAMGHGDLPTLAQKWVKLRATFHP